MNKLLQRGLAVLTLTIVTTATFAQDVQRCGRRAHELPKDYTFSGSDMSMKTGPDFGYPTVVSTVGAGRKYSSSSPLLLKANYKLTVTCKRGSWSRVAVMEPEELSETHFGWVRTTALMENVRS